MGGKESNCLRVGAERRENSNGYLPVAAEEGKQSCEALGGSECGPDEPGELVHRGALVSQGYWNDPVRTAERFKPLPAGVGGREAGLPLPEIAVFSGDTVRRDAEGFLYFVSRRDEMIKTSGYRVSPGEMRTVRSLRPAFCAMRS